MKLKEMKSNVLRFIEEYSNETSALTKDKDIQNKINIVINQVMFDLCKYKKLSDMATITVVKDQTINLYETDELERFSQLLKIDGIDYDIIDKFVTFNESGNAKIFYYKNPVIINENTPDTYTFELSDDVLAIMPVGVAAELYKGDPANQYGQIYSNKYKELLQLLDPRHTQVMIKIGDGGLDV